MANRMADKFQREVSMRINELTDEQATAFGHALLRWLTDEDPAQAARLFPTLDPHSVADAGAADLGRSVLEDILAERFIRDGTS
jgi:hypothetical protein